MTHQRSEQHVSLEELWLDRAVYRPGEPANLHMLLHNPGKSSLPVQLHLSLTWLDEQIWQHSQHVELPTGKYQLVLPLKLPEESVRGYGVDLLLCDAQHEPWIQKSTSLDVLDNWAQAPRYGFLADFAPGEQAAEEVCARLARYHVNIAQFYDWMWRHYALMPPDDEFVDACERRISLQAVREKVAACRAQGIAAFGYAAVYGAEPEYALEHPDEMLYDESGDPYSLGKLFYIMNIHQDNSWRVRILAEMAQAVRAVPFDGLHLDQYGIPRAHAFGPAPERTRYDLATDFPVFIDAARQALRQTQPDSQVIFNAVENWPIETVASSSQDATYIEVWPPYEYYYDLQKLILEARHLAPQKQVILAAYLAPLKGAQGDDLPLAEAATRLASAVIWASGGFHLLLGERDGALCDPYYPAYASMRADFASVMRTYYDFVVRYENTLSDLRLVTLPVVEAQRRIRLESIALSVTGEAGKVWAIVRQMPQFSTVSLINLSTIPDARWNVPKPLPSALQNLNIEIMVDEEITGVYAASPDRDEGRPHQLPYRLLQKNGATWLCTSLPALEYWSMITIKKSARNPR